MPVTLEQMRVGMSDKIAQQVVDTMIRESQIMDMLTFDDCVSPGSGSTLTYGYIQKKKPSATGFRALNTEYTASQATVEKKTVDLKIFGGKFQIDRVINAASGRYDNLAFQMEEKIISAIGTFHDAMINGDSAGQPAGTASSFDGLDKMLLGQESELNTDKVIDLSDMTKLKANADEFYEALQTLINVTGAQAILVSSDMKTKIQTVARILGYKTESEDAFGRKITSIGEGVRIATLGNTYTVNVENVTAKEIIGKYARTVGETPQTGVTDIFGVRFDVMDGFHGVSLTGNSSIRQYLPDFNSTGAVKDGEVEMVAAVALKNTRAAGVLRNIKIGK